MELKTNVAIRYCQAIDRFIKVRVFSEGEIQQLFNRVNLTDRRSYQHLVINAAIVNYNDDVLKDILYSKELKRNDVGWLEEEFYQLCIKINPDLDINRLSVTVEEEASSEKLFLLEGEEKRGFGRGIEDLETRLKERLVGQDEAAAKVTKALKRAFVGINPPERPYGVFLFAGQTGVGKTELAKRLSELVLGDTGKMLRIDCSEFALPHEYAKLIGAPPGYVGYDDGGILSGPMLANPQRIVLFDEIEKAHPKVHNLLLQIMDEGFVTDNKGQKVHFNKSIVIMTTNVGAGEIAQVQGAIGFGNRSGEVDHRFKERETMNALENTFAPEFLNRIDDVIVFRALGHDDHVRIVEMLLGQIKDRLSAVGKEISFPRALTSHLARKIDHSRYGARPLKRIITRFIEAPLSDCLLSGRFRDVKRIKTSLKGGKVVFSPA